MMVTQDKKSFWVPVAIVIFSVAIHLLYYNVGLSLNDEGFLANTTLRILNGERPYIDFASAYPPGGFYLFALLFKIFSVDLLVIRLTWVVLLGFCSLLIYQVGKRIMPWHFAAMAAISFAILPGAWHKSFLYFFTLINTYLILLYIENRDIKRLLLSAIICGITIYFRQDVAGFTAAVFISIIVAYRWLFPDKWKDVGVAKLGFTYAGVVSIFFAPSVVVYLCVPAFRKGIDAMFGFMFKKVNSLSLPFPGPNFWPMEQHFANLLFYLVLSVYIAVALIVISSPRSKKNLVLLPIFMMGVLNLNQVRMRADAAHILQNVSIFYLMFFFLVSLAYDALKGELIRKIFNICAIILLSAFFAYNAYSPNCNFYTGSIGTIKTKEYLLDTPRARVWVDKGTGEAVKAVIKDVSSAGKPGDYMLTVPFFNMLNFMTGMRDPNYYSWVSPDTINTLEREYGLIESLEKTNTNVVLFSDMKIDGMEKRQPKNYAPLIQNYLDSRFRLLATHGEFQVLVRKGGMPKNSIVDGEPAQ